MNTETRKLNLIDQLIKTSSEQVIEGIEQILSRQKKVNNQKKGFNQFVGLMTKKEANSFRDNIEKGCENIDTDEWKLCFNSYQYCYRTIFRRTI